MLRASAVPFAVGKVAQANKVFQDSSAESRLSLGIGRLDFHGDHQRRVRCQPQYGQVFSFQVERHVFREIQRGFIQRLALGDDGDFQALGDVA